MPLIAETGGLNAMIVDSTALPDRWSTPWCRAHSLGRPALLGAAPAGGARVHRDGVKMMAGAMETARGRPADLSTDVGPVIDDEAHAPSAQQRLDDGQAQGFGRKFIAQTALPAHPGLTRRWRSRSRSGPDRPTCSRDEVFGPVLHVVRWERRAADR